ncbi:Cytochrome-c oxidase, cbb3-type subunit II [Gammaproteobacteria bacterium]
MSYEIVEKNTGWLVFIILFVISIGGLAEIVPLFFLTAPEGVGSTVEPVQGLQPYDALRLEGRDIYLREGCSLCHSQMVRPFYTETERYDDYSVAGESVYDHPFLWGSKRTGPDLARIGSLYSDSWHQEHLRDPSSVVPGSIMPPYPWLEKNILDGALTTTKMRAMNALISLTCPKCKTYSEKEIEAGPAKVRGKTEEDALIAYLNGDAGQPGGLGRFSPQAR